MVVTSALEPLRTTRKLNPYRETAQMELEPWLLDRTLSPAEQKATRTPHKGPMARMVASKKPEEAQLMGRYFR
jgi:hypothetical protein